MVKVTLKDGSIIEVEKGVSILDVAKKISEGLARSATCGEIDGNVKDLRFCINEDCNLVIHTFKEDDLEGKKAYWHTASHIMAQAVMRLFPSVKFAIGPAIDEGFYYDFDVEKPFTDEDKEKIEAEMKKIIKENLSIERFSLPKEEALKLMTEQPYKQELINDLPDGEEISFYKQGDFTDLCAGPHLESTGKVKIVNWQMLEWDTEEQIVKRRSVDKRGVKSDEAYTREVLGEMANCSNILVINDEAHHAWRKNPEIKVKLTGEEKEARENLITSLKSSIERREKLLSNENYVNKAPANIVEMDRQKLEEEKNKLKPTPLPK